MARQKKEITECYQSPFAVALRDLMFEQSVTQDVLARVTDKKRQTISQYTNGISEPGYDTLVKIADFFDVSIDYLLGRTKDKRRSHTIYDEVGLSEKSITILRTAHDALSIQEKLDEFNTMLERKSISGRFHSVDKEKQEFYRIIDASKTRLYARVLPVLIDDIIDAALNPYELLNSYAQLVYPDCRPSGLSNIMDENEYISYKIGQIADIIKYDLAFRHIDVGPL